MHDERRSVIVIDDEYGARLQVELALLTSDTAYFAGEASNGMRGAELAERLQPDVIVLDLSMPLMSGIEALPLLRTVAPDARILIRSSEDDPGVIQAALDLGACAFVPKMQPIDDIRELVESVDLPRPSPLFASLSHTTRFLVAPSG